MTNESGERPAQRQDVVQVYVVSSVNYGEQEGVMAVFSDQARADEFAASANKTPGSTYYVTAWELDEATAEGNSHE